MAAPMDHVHAQRDSEIVLRNTKQLVKDVLGNRKDANKIIDLIHFTKSSDVNEVRQSTEALHLIFISHIKEGRMYKQDPQLAKEDFNTSDLSKEDKYKLWLSERYTDCLLAFVELLHHPTHKIKELALVTLMKLIKEESNHPLKNIDNTLPFPASNFEPVVNALLSHEDDCEQLIARFQEYLEFDDVRHFTMKFSLRSLQKKSVHTDVYHNNVFHVLKSLSMPEAPEDDQLTNFMSEQPDPNLKCKLNSYKEEKKLFTTLWLEFLKKKMNPSLYKQVLVILHEKVMPFMTSPLLLSDFLTESYDIGGVTSLLALNGLFVLVHKYNLEYPEFYTKLYSLLDPGVFHVKYKARFFFLTDLFLTSTHLPAYLVAAFVKKMARLSLTAPPSGLGISIPFIYNLINRHPNCRVLLHNAESTDISKDPFNMEETDPRNCNAMKSSLWELDTLQQHYHYTVSTEAKKINRPLSKEEIDLSDFLETTTAEMFAKESKKKIKQDIATTYQPPKGLFENPESAFTDLWTLS